MHRAFASVPLPYQILAQNDILLYLMPQKLTAIRSVLATSRISRHLLLTCKLLPCSKPPPDPESMNSTNSGVSREDDATRHETLSPTHTDSTSRTTGQWRGVNRLCLPVSDSSTATGAGLPGTAGGASEGPLGRNDRALMHLHSAAQGSSSNVNPSQQPQEAAIEAQRMAALREANSKASFNPSSESAGGAP